MNRRSHTLCFAALTSLTVALGACGSEKKVYEKKPAPTGRAAAIPQPPTLPKKAKKESDGSWTVSGIAHDLRSEVHKTSVDGKDVTITGYIVRTNLVACKDPKATDGIEEDCAPICACHETGKGDDQKGEDDKKKPAGPAKAADPAEVKVDCKQPVPAFWIAETADPKPGDDIVKVVDWATNFAGIYSAIQEYDKESDAEKRKAIAKMDSGGKTIPNPIPAVGARVKVTGRYGTTVDVGSSPIAEPRMGVMAVKSIEVIQEAPELAGLPNLERKKPKDKK